MTLWAIEGKVHVAGVLDDGGVLFAVIVAITSQLIIVPFCFFSPAIYHSKLYLLSYTLSYHILCSAMYFMVVTAS